ncbi:MAG: hypothetical protein ACE5KZ_10605 [Candidatus Scalinduaceae bacterium]
MDKKKALGTDPLSWLKGKNKEDNQNNDEVNYQEKKSEELPESNDVDTSNTENKKQKRNIYEPSDVTEKYRETILGKKSKTSATSSKESPATIFVVVYTILLLVLGFLVYRDMTKRINKLETKLANIEKQFESSYESYNDPLLDEIW